MLDQDKQGIMHNPQGEAFDLYLPHKSTLFGGGGKRVQYVIQTTENTSGVWLVLAFHPLPGIFKGYGLA